MLPDSVWAGSLTSLGDMADSFMQPLAIVSDFFSSAAMIIGASFLFAALIKYQQHRVNPLFVPIGTVVILVVMGVLLISLPLTYRLLQHDVASGLYYGKK